MSTQQFEPMDHGDELYSALYHLMALNASLARPGVAGMVAVYLARHDNAPRRASVERTIALLDQVLASAKHRGKSDE